MSIFGVLLNKMKILMFAWNEPKMKSLFCKWPIVMIFLFNDIFSSYEVIFFTLLSSSNGFLKISEFGAYFFRFFRPRQKKPYTHR